MIAESPTKGVKASKPRFKSAKEQIPLLSERYLKLRNRQMSHKAAEAELNLAIRRRDSISKELVTRQAAYLMVSLRQRLLNLPVHAHKLVGLDADGMRKALREIAISTLNEIKDLPSAVSNPNWFKELEKDEGE